MTTLLQRAVGATCTAGYLASGSVWPDVVVHWLTVVVWIVLLGGQELVGTRVGTELAVVPKPAHASASASSNAVAPAR